MILLSLGFLLLMVAGFALMTYGMQVREKEEGRRERYSEESVYYKAEAGVSRDFKSASERPFFGEDVVVRVKRAQDEEKTEDIG